MNNKSEAERFWEKVERKSDDECWGWKAYIKPTGYGQFTTSDATYVNASRMSWILTYGDISKDLEVCHKCDNRECVNPNHLFLGTHKDNMYDMRDKGRGKLPPVNYGSQNKSTKLSKFKVLKIHKLYDSGEMSMRELGKKYGVTAQAIWLVVHNKNWNMKNHPDFASKNK